MDTSREHCAKANACNSSALIYAATAGHHDVVQELLDTSRPNHATTDGWQLVKLEVEVPDAMSGASSSRLTVHRKNDVRRGVRVRKKVKVRNGSK